MQPQVVGPFQSQLPQKARHWPWLGGLITTVVLLAAVLMVYSLRQAATDRFRVLFYTPTSAISTIIKDSTMVDGGAFYFKASTPEVDSSSDFNVHCARTEANSAILGCYVDQKIYIYDVKNDTRLTGIKTVTAAHEMLHAAWERLSDSEKDRLSKLLKAAYEKVKTTELAGRMDYYTRQEAGHETEELHSILGTEFMNLGDELDKYYNSYFSDRVSLVDMHTKYAKNFDDIIAKQKTLQSKISETEADLKTRTEAYNSDVKQLNADIAALEASRSNIDTTSWLEVNNFNKQRAALISRINNLAVERTAIIAEQSTYDGYVAEYNQLVIVGQGLVNSLDSTLDTPATVQ